MENHGTETRRIYALGAEAADREPVAPTVFLPRPARQIRDSLPGPDRCANPTQAHDELHPPSYWQMAKSLIVLGTLLYVMLIALPCTAPTYDSRLFIRQLYLDGVMVHCTSIFANADVYLYGRNSRRGILAVDPATDALQVPLS